MPIVERIAARKICAFERVADIVNVNGKETHSSLMARLDLVSNPLSLECFTTEQHCCDGAPFQLTIDPLLNASGASFCFLKVSAIVERSGFTSLAHNPRLTYLLYSSYVALIVEAKKNFACHCQTLPCNFRISSMIDGINDFR